MRRLQGVTLLLFWMFSVNVALHKNANMSSKYKTANASYAVNGITGTTFSGPGYTSDTTLWNCVHTDPKVASSYWLVDLGQDYAIRDVTIYRRSGSMGLCFLLVVVLVIVVLVVAAAVDVVCLLLPVRAVDSTLKSSS